MEDNLKIGLIGGTFDPVHIGHLALAEEAYEVLSLDKIIFIPAFTPPHKDPKFISNVEHRVKMLKLAISDLHYCEISDIEVKKQDVCYTCDTLKELREVYPSGTDFTFLVGSDFIQDYTTWKNYQELPGLATFVIAVRPGFGLSELPEGMRLLEGNFPFVSSSDIRIIVNHGDNVAKQLPYRVFDYIKKNKIYK